MTRCGLSWVTVAATSAAIFALVFAAVVLLLFVRLWFLERKRS